MDFYAFLEESEPEEEEPETKSIKKNNCIIQ